LQIAIKEYFTSMVDGKTCQQKIILNSARTVTSNGIEFKLKGKENSSENQSCFFHQLHGNIETMELLTIVTY